MNLENLLCIFFIHEQLYIQTCTDMKCSIIYYYVQEIWVFHIGRNLKVITSQDELSVIDVVFVIYVLFPLPFKNQVADDGANNEVQFSRYFQIFRGKINCLQAFWSAMCEEINEMIVLNHKYTWMVQKLDMDWLKCWICYSIIYSKWEMDWPWVGTGVWLYWNVTPWVQK